MIQVEVEWSKSVEERFDAKEKVLEVYYEVDMAESTVMVTIEPGCQNAGRTLWADGAKFWRELELRRISGPSKRGWPGCRMK